MRAPRSLACAGHSDRPLCVRPSTQAEVSMTDQVGPPENIQANDDAKRHERAALEGEPGIPDVGQPPRVQVSRKAVVTVALLVLSLIAVSAISIQRLIGAKKSEDA